MTDICAWTEDEFDGYWETACGQAHEFTDGGPAENKHVFCPYCGRKLVEVRAQREEDDE